jgi:hypothetical protein
MKGTGRADLKAGPYESAQEQASNVGNGLQAVPSLPVYTAMTSNCS